MKRTDQFEQSLMTIKQTAAILHCSEQNVYALIEQGELPYIPIGKSKGYRIDPSDLTNFIRGVLSRRLLLKQ